MRLSDTCENRFIRYWSHSSCRVEVVNGDSQLSRCQRYICYHPQLDELKKYETFYSWSRLVLARQMSFVSTDGDQWEQKTTEYWFVDIDQFLQSQVMEAKQHRPSRRLAQKYQERICLSRVGYVCLFTKLDRHRSCQSPRLSIWLNGHSKSDMDSTIDSGSIDLANRSPNHVE